MSPKYGSISQLSHSPQGKMGVLEKKRGGGRADPHSAAKIDEVTLLDLGPK